MFSLHPGERIENLYCFSGDIAHRGCSPQSQVLGSLHHTPSQATRVINHGLSHVLVAVLQVISAVGASEGTPLDSSAPRRIDGDGNISLIEAASASGVEQFVLISSLGTGKIGFPAVVLNLFGGVLTQKRRAEEALERSGLSYLIVRPGGMERPKDNFKLTHNLTVKRRDSTFGGQVGPAAMDVAVVKDLQGPPCFGTLMKS